MIHVCTTSYIIDCHTFCDESSLYKFMIHLEYNHATWDKIKFYIGFISVVLLNIYIILFRYLMTTKLISARF